ERYARDVVGLRKTIETEIADRQASATSESRPLWAALGAAWQKREPLQDQLRKLIEQNEHEKATELSFGATSQNTNELLTQLDNIPARNRKTRATAEDRSTSQYESARTMLISAVAIALLIAAGMGIWMSLGISRALGRAGSLAQAVAGGDLTQTIDYKSR